ncbi:lysostaphin resistance A-like protein [Chloroflexota bacterium]
MTIQDATLPTGSETSEPRKGIWGPWATAGFGAIIGLAVIAAQIIAIIAYAAVKAISNRPADFFEFLFSLSPDGLLISITGIFSAAVGLTLIALFIKLRRGYSIREYLGFGLPSKKLIPGLIALAGVFTLISEWLSYIPGRTEPEFIELLLTAYNTSVWPILFWLNIVVFAPALEEAFFRGFIFAGFRRSRIGVAGTIIITSLVWTLLHLWQYDIYDLGSLFAFGIVVGVIREKTNSIWGAFIPHSINNFVAMVLLTLTFNNPSG